MALAVSIVLQSQCYVGRRENVSDLRSQHTGAERYRFLTRRNLPHSVQDVFPNQVKDEFLRISVQRGGLK